ncbi:putative zinc-binding metallo-peptidase [Mucilaginibacter gracilis]|uniref:Putative zinc-binding metallo-peptidase n=1 Tax=Mucilaginibacter gracilis TaxID=423350 RepID=A0A495J889_9SPHI|nr:putative zinc-binding metallopeptidase [Mucilaginibacter gracilis]RKR85097.1 putative zinc-binding metallo-peptidase [Mucilaginibacter gracilis]
MYKNLCISFSLLAAVLVMFQACKKEAAILAIDQNYGYTVPQGNHTYDKTIVDFYNKYGTYMLYKFSDKDTYWTPTGWKNSTLSTTLANFWSTGYLATQADTSSADYITRQLVVLNKLWFGFYSDRFLKQFLPVKVMLCNTVDSVYSKASFSPTLTYARVDTYVGAWYNYDNLCVSYGNSSVANMVQRDSIAFAKKVNLIFMQSIITRNMSAPTTDFTALTNYGVTYTTTATAYAAGIIAPYSGVTSQLDWAQYMQAMVTCTEATLNRSQANTVNSYVGILNVTKDTSGKIRQRYNVVRNYFINTYGVDLQAIGNYAGR